MTIEEIIYETGMTLEEAKNSWAYKNPEQAKVILEMKKKYLEVIRNVVNLFKNVHTIK